MMNIADTNFLLHILPAFDREALIEAQNRMHRAEYGGVEINGRNMQELFTITKGVT